LFKDEINLTNIEQEQS